MFLACKLFSELPAQFLSRVFSQRHNKVFDQSIITSTVYRIRLNLTLKLRLYKKMTVTALSTEPVFGLPDFG